MRNQQLDETGFQKSRPFLLTLHVCFFSPYLRHDLDPLLTAPGAAKTSRQIGERIHFALGIQLFRREQPHLAARGASAPGFQPVVAEHVDVGRLSHGSAKPPSDWFPAALSLKGLKEVDPA
jgi:hypothetical protein